MAITRSCRRPETNLDELSDEMSKYMSRASKTTAAKILGNGINELDAQLRGINVEREPWRDKCC